MAKETKTISYDLYLKTLALFTFANHHYVKAREAQLLMDELLGEADGSNMDDALYNDEIARTSDFDRTLGYAGIIVESK